MVSPETTSVYLYGVRWSSMHYVSVIYKFFVITWSRMVVDGIEHRLNKIDFSHVLQLIFLLWYCDIDFRFENLRALVISSINLSSITDLEALPQIICISIDQKSG